MDAKGILSHRNSTILVLTVIILVSDVFASDAKGESRNSAMVQTINRRNTVGDFRDTPGGGVGGSGGGVVSSSDMMEKNKNYLRLKNTLPYKDDMPIIIRIHLSLESIRDVAGEATIDMYMQESWTDSREAFEVPEKSRMPDGTYDKAKYDNSSNVYDIRMSGAGVVNYCWIPDTYFILARSIFYSPSSLSLSVQSGGEVTLDRKVRLVTPCKPQVQYFPFDVTTCRILISSYGFDIEEMYLIWDRFASDNGEGISFPFEYEPLSEMGFKILNMQSTCFKASYSGVTFTILEGVVHLERLYTVYIYQIYIPAALLVVLSWVTFWINKGATPARASVGVTTVLTMLTLATQSQQNMEKHITLETSLLDIYIWACFSFVIAAMLEFAMSDFLNDQATRKAKEAARKESQAAENKIQQQQQLPSVHLNNMNSSSPLLITNGGANGASPITSTHFIISEPQSKKKEQDSDHQSPSLLTTKIDRAARILFPATFLVFNCIYWTYVAYILMNSSVSETNKSNAEPCTFS